MTMSTNLLSAMTAALLTAACLTALADSSDQQKGELFQASTTSAPAAGGNDAADDASGFIQAVGRNGSHSMHPNAPVVAEQLADDDAKVPGQTGDQ